MAPFHWRYDLDRSPPLKLFIVLCPISACGRKRSGTLTSFQDADKPSFTPDMKFSLSLTSASDCDCRLSVIFYVNVLKIMLSGLLSGGATSPVDLSAHTGSLSGAAVKIASIQLFVCIKHQLIAKWLDRTNLDHLQLGVDNLYHLNKLNRCCLTDQPHPVFVCIYHSTRKAAWTCYCRCFLSSAAHYNVWPSRKSWRCSRRSYRVQIRTFITVVDYASSNDGDWPSDRYMFQHGSAGDSLKAPFVQHRALRFQPARDPAVSLNLQSADSRPTIGDRFTLFLVSVLQQFAQAV